MHNIDMIQAHFNIFAMMFVGITVPRLLAVMQLIEAIIILES
ncbi:hypothetical protein LPICM02_330007 [Pseudolactococcus piscium]|nr:hypothetical protein LPICM02_330007 [Lactococcus piscium]